MPVAQFACIVEGPGDAHALPVLLSRLVALYAPDLALNISPVYEVPRNKMVKSGELERYVDLAAKRLQPPGAVFILLDADDDLPCELGPALLSRAMRSRPDVPATVVVANREFEAWLLAGAESLRGYRGIPATIMAPANPELVRGAKERISQWLPADRNYSEINDQAKLTRLSDLARVRQVAPSFDKCWREVERLLREFDLVH